MGGSSEEVRVTEVVDGGSLPALAPTGYLGALRDLQIKDLEADAAAEAHLDKLIGEKTRERVTSRSPPCDGSGGHGSIQDSVLPPVGTCAGIRRWRTV
jgi:hypothetical protein